MRGTDHVRLTPTEVVALIPDGEGITHDVHHERHGGTWVVVHFPNGYGASVIDHDYSYDLEMAVLHPKLLCYATPVTSDVLGYLTPSDLASALRMVAALPPDAACEHRSLDLC